MGSPEVLLSRVVPAGGSAVKLVERDDDRVTLLIAQDGTSTDKVRIGSRNVTASIGHPLVAGERIALRRDEGAGAEWFMIAETGTPNVVVTEVVDRVIGGGR